MGTPTRRTGLPKHISDSTTHVGQDHVATRVLLVLGTNNYLHRLENAAEQATRTPLDYTGQAGEQHRSDRSMLAKSETFHKRPLLRSGWCSLPFRPVQDKKSQIHQTDLPSSKLNLTRNSRNMRQQGTHQDVHRAKLNSKSALIRPE
jgi:hypothetical protein